jgi:hypothetical protein
MDDIIAVAVTTDTDHVCFFVTWGRIQDAVDPKQVEAIVLKAAGGFATPGRPVSARVCHSLQEASATPYFHEAMFSMGQTKIPFGIDTYKPWRQEIDTAMRAGKQIRFVGPNRYHVLDTAP